ncbi:MAG TPA: carbamoyltransferase HypF, partial [Bacteroidales bacterium]|nr:carbamoyltransferase HypF [Bacteroidales bacterium]
CGPRFTIIQELPYDRKNTTMAEFDMCPSCREEYITITNRRFHAQPVACNHCGPVYTLKNGEQEKQNINDIIAYLSKLIKSGAVVALKGTGGYHLACDAMNEEAVKKLRNGKVREKKPFAVMFRDDVSLAKYAVVNQKEHELLSSWRRPIVLLQSKKSLAPSVSMGFPTLGAMLPYMPFHYLLFEKLETPAIVLTSGNISDEPVIIDDPEAKKRLGPITDAIVQYNRAIHNRCDDSVSMVVNQKPRLLRRSRGYAPSPIRLPLNTEGIIATGAELVNCFCIGKGNQGILSQHIGDLKNYETYTFYTESLERFKRLFRVSPSLMAADLHPDYLSTRYAMETGLPVEYIQHHHAHIASCMAEHGLNEKVIGVSMDGTGMGTDGNIWGGEFLICDYADFVRSAHFEYIPAPGGDKVTHEPWRMALSYLNHVFPDMDQDILQDIFEDVPLSALKLVREMITKNINCPLTSSAGRLFDAVAALTGICRYSGFHAEAPMKLEAILDPSVKDAYPFSGFPVISFRETISAILNDYKKKVSPSIIAARFHNTIISVIFITIKKIKADTRINKVVLSGGVFQNRYLLEQTEKLLQNNHIEVYSHQSVPTNDGGIALGQLMVAAKRRTISCV